ncbi:hypothetical protein [Escherichia coli]|nr:hypothetical protein [Escherichia coli]
MLMAFHRHIAKRRDGNFITVMGCAAQMTERNVCGPVHPTPMLFSGQ